MRFEILVLILLGIITFVESGNPFPNIDVDEERLGQFEKTRRLLVGEDPHLIAYDPLPTKRERLESEVIKSSNKQRRNAIEKIKESFKKRKI